MSSVKREKKTRKVKKYRNEKNYVGSFQALRDSATFSSNVHMHLSIRRVEYFSRIFYGNAMNHVDHLGLVVLGCDVFFVCIELLIEDMF